ncbi:MAG: gliding motility-associated peptidyl-prolyl isomerase GldI [Bacteroidota bacterium]
MKIFYLIVCLLLLAGCKTPEARKPESVQSGSFIKESAERNKKLNEKEYAQIKSIISKDTINTYLASESGFWYRYDVQIEKDTIQAQFGDVINFDYNLKDLNGVTIYTSTEIGNQDYIMDKQELFTGLREGLKLMKPGESVTFLFPSQKAFGYYGDKNRIGTNVPLISDVTLNSIEKTEN